MSYQLFDYQNKVVDFICSPYNRHIVVVHETGCGKTITAVAAIKQLEDEFELIYYFAPVSVHSHVISTLSEFGVKQDKVQVCSFHNLLHPSVNGINKMIIIDEVHNLRNRKSIMANRAIEVCNEALKIIVMTATPYVNTITDLENIIDMCCGPITYDTKRTGNNLIERLERLNISCVRNPPLADDFPTVIQRNIMIKMNSEESNIYARFLRMDLKEVDNILHQRVGSIGKMFMVHCNGMRRVGDSGISILSPKIRYLKLTMRNYSQQVIFSSWTEAGVFQIEQLLIELQIPFRTITGKTPRPLRNKSIEEYNNQFVNVLLFSRAGGEGINLIGTRRVVILEPAWNAAIEKQAMSRCIRYKSHHHLPPDQRNIIIEKLYIVGVEKTCSSVDLLLVNKYVKTKKIDSEKCLDMLERLSI